MSSHQEKLRLSNIDAVVLALYELGGEQGFVDTEDIAVVADRIAPSQFRWRKYPNQINLDTARVALRDATRKRMVSGRMERGWSLTVSGLTWAVANVQGRLNLENRAPSDRRAGRRQHFERSRIQALPALLKYANNESVSRREAESVFRVDDYSSPERRTQSMERIKSLFANDSQMRGFLEAMAQIIIEREGENNERSADS